MKTIIYCRKSTDTEDKQILSLEGQERELRELVAKAGSLGRCWNRYTFYMKQLILVRYGQYEDGHLTEEGIETMERAAMRLNDIEIGTSRLLAANTPRAVESAEVLARSLGTQVEICDELYAAGEDGKLPSTSSAWALLKSRGEACDSLIAVVSREYIETLPSLILGSEAEVSLDRGQCLVIDLETNVLTYLKD